MRNSRNTTSRKYQIGKMLIVPTLFRKLPTVPTLSIEIGIAITINSPCQCELQLRPSTAHHVARRAEVKVCLPV